MRSNADFAAAIDLHEQGCVSEAIAIYDELLAIKRTANCLLARGLAALHLGDVPNAISFLLEASLQEPQRLEILTGLGDAYVANSQLDRAANYFQRAVSLEPNLIAIWQKLAHLHSQLGQVEQSMAAWLRVVQLDPGSIGAYRKLAEYLQAYKRHAEAEQILLKALEQDPESTLILHDLGVLLQGQKRFREAAEYFDRCTRVDVSQAGAWCNLGACYHDLQRHEQAEAALQQAVRLEDRFAGAHFNLGNLYRDMGRHDRAMTHYLRAIELEPQNASFRLNAVTVLNSLGRFEEAAEQCRILISQDPDCAKAYYNLFTFNAESVTDEEAEQLKVRMKSWTLSDEERSSAYFSLGKRSDRLKKYDEAFEYFAEANRLSPRRTRFDENQLRSNLDRLIEVFSGQSAEFWDRRGSETEQPIFILGLPRSGSTLVDQILTSHPLVSGAGEFDGMRFLINNFLNKAFQRSGQEELKYPYSIRELTQSLVSELSEAYLQRMHGVAGNTFRITDKMPNNAFQLGLISLLFPRATVIYTWRDPRDIGLSCYFQNFTSFHEFSYDLRNIGKFIREHVRVMQEWRTSLPIQIYDVVYEKLVASQEEQTRRLIVDVCGLPWDERCLDFHQNKRAVHTASLWQVRQPLYAGSVGKWKKYASHLQPLLDELGELVEDQAAA